MGCCSKYAGCKVNIVSFRFIMYNIDPPQYRQGPGRMSRPARGGVVQVNRGGWKEPKRDHTQGSTGTLATLRV